VAQNLSRIYYQSLHWRQLRAERLEIDCYRCTVPGCGDAGPVVVDHETARPNCAEPTPLDVIENLRTLCRTHDAQVKEKHRSDALSRRNGGLFHVKGCDEDGWPLDPRRS
jgi:hypothetical protein